MIEGFCRLKTPQSVKIQVYFKWPNCFLNIYNIGKFKHRVRRKGWSGAEATGDEVGRGVRSAVGVGMAVAREDMGVTSTVEAPKAARSARIFASSGSRKRYVISAS